MIKFKVAVIMVLGFGVLAFAFNNCSQVDFEKGVDTPSVSGLAVNDGSTITDPGVIDDLINQLPPIEQETLRPVTDLLNDPSLFEVFKCTQSDGAKGVVICHFPDNVTSQMTKCLPPSAVKSHFDHERNYNLTGLEKTISDYLGPCRFPL